MLHLNLQVILAIKHKIIPPTINVQEPPKLRDGTNIQDSAIFINTRMRPWFPPPGVPRRAGVSSFGFGGSNYHCVVEEYESEHTAPYASPFRARCPFSVPNVCKPNRQECDFNYPT